MVMASPVPTDGFLLLPLESQQVGGAFKASVPRVQSNSCEEAPSGRGSSQGDTERFGG